MRGMHACDLPSLSAYRLVDYRTLHRYKWMCPVCHHVYSPREREEGIGPVYEWVMLWPWSEWLWRRRGRRKP